MTAKEINKFYRDKPEDFPGACERSTGTEIFHLRPRVVMQRPWALRRFFVVLNSSWLQPRQKLLEHRIELIRLLQIHQMPAARQNSKLCIRHPGGDRA